MQTLFSVLTVAIGLGLVIFLHELGHFAVAKWANVLVERFSIGFGPVLWSFRRGETEYAISAIPFGGYVKMLGQDDANPNTMVQEQMKLDPRSYPAQSVPKRMAIISAGVIMNLVTGFLMFLLVFNLGVPYTPPVIGAVEPGTPAWEVGLERGDRVLAVDGEEIVEFEQFQQAVMLSDVSEGLELKVARGETTHTFQVSPDSENQLAPEIGVERSRSLIVSQPPSGGFAAARASGNQFRPNDQITQLNGQPIGSYTRLADFLARHAAEEVRFTLERPGKGDAAETVELTVPPQYMVDLGLRFQMGKIAGIRHGSPAEQAGLKVGDVIQSVNGKSFDPFRLPNQMAELAGQSVQLEVKRQAQGPQTLMLSITPDDRPAWLHPPRDGNPLSVPALGIAYHLVPEIIEQPEPDSPAAQAGLQKYDRVTGAILVVTRASGKTEEGSVIKIDDKDQMLPAIFWAVQQSPNPAIRWRIKRGDAEYLTKPIALERDLTWASPIRGIALKPLMEPMRAQGFVQALSLGYETTKSTVVSVYLTLRRLLFSRSISPKLIVGPVGIVRGGIHFAGTDIVLFIKFLAIISVNLAIINFLPIPVLDGGHMVFLIWEGVRGKPPSEKVVVAANYAGLLLILTLALLVTGHDIWQLVW